MINDGIIVLGLALLFDRLFGEPPDKIHPTIYMGRFIGFLDKKLSKGWLIYLLVTIPFSFTALLIVHFPEEPVRILVAAVILKTTFSWRGLGDYTRPIAKALSSSNLKLARKGVPFIAGRPAEKLTKREVISTAVESIAESSVDGVISPLFYYLLFSSLELKFGVAAAVFYRSSNTLDSMIGLPENPKGRLIAKADELLNLAPSRMGAIILLLSSFLLKLDTKKGFIVFKRDRNKTKSRNAGQTMSAMAGILGVKLIKKGAYELGDGKIELETWHIYKALKVVDVQIMLYVALMVIIWIYVIK